LVAFCLRGKHWQHTLPHTPIQAGRRRKRKLKKSEKYLENALFDDDLFFDIKNVILFFVLLYRELEVEFLFFCGVK
jgi:hypothetical protein